ncbi:hypothetical protein V6N13_132352 [Hibiscus sabdariffa]
MTGEPATEVPVNGGRNYNGPKVAKFLVGLGGRRRRPPSGGPEPSVRYNSWCTVISQLPQGTPLPLHRASPLPHASPPTACSSADLLGA